MVRARSRLIAVAAILAVVGVGAVGGLGTDVRAQDATPMAGAGAAYPNHIHLGTCATLGEVVAPLADLQYRGVGAAAGGMQASPEAGMMGATPMAGMMGAAIPVAVGVTEVPLALADIIAGGHAINVHDPADIGLYVACGDIVGTPDEQGNLFVGLGELNASGLAGIAWLQDDGSGAGTTVTVFLGNFGMMGGLGEMGDDAMMATPAA